MVLGTRGVTTILPQHEPHAFTPSQDLPDGRTLAARDVISALTSLRWAFGLPPPGTPAIRRVHPGAAVPRDEWPSWFAPLLPEQVVYTAKDLSEAQRAGQAEQHQIGVDDAFEHSVALNWLQRIVSYKVAVEDVHDDSDTNQILEAAAELLACAAGRSASGPETTTFYFPSKSPQSPNRPQEDSDIQVTLRDMTLVDDALGGRTWGAAPLLAAELVRRRSWSGNVLELGAGTGLVGLALAAGSASDNENTQVVLTDHHPTVLANLEYNVSLWRSEHTQSSVQVVTSSLDWWEVYAASVGLGSNTTTSRSTTAQTLPSSVQPISGTSISSTPATTPGNTTPVLALGTTTLSTTGFQTIIAADCVYDPAHPVWIRAVAHKYLSCTPEARLHLTSPLRETHRAEIEALLSTFPAEASSSVPQLVVLDASIIYGQDDFGGSSRAQRLRDQDGANWQYLRLEVGWSSLLPSSSS